MSDRAALLALAEAEGIARVWHDIEGHRQETSPETALALLRAMGTIEAAEDAADRLRQRETASGWHSPRAMVLAPGAPLILPAAAGQEWHLALEGDAAPAQEIRPEGTGSDGGLRLVGVPLGLHRLSLRGGTLTVIVAPTVAPTLETLTGGSRAWGVTGAIHALWQGDAETCGPRGRYDDLATAAEALAPLGAAFLGINPVHAIGAAHAGFSPYSPGHRGFLDTRAIPGAEGLPGSTSGLIDHAADRIAHDRALRQRFAVELSHPDGPATLAAYRAAKGPSLEAFALYEALSLHLGADWRRWPAGFEGPHTADAAAFAANAAEEIAFHAWAQMSAEAALAEAQDRARRAGMALGIYADLAVGVRPDGPEVWARPGTFARGVSLGAPPDMFAPEGQSWGLAPFNPAGLAADHYAAFVQTLRATLAQAGMLRIDHVLGLERTFWVPEDGTPGGYVASDREALMALVRLEATRSRALIIGEDLGVVPEGLRQRLSETRLYGCSVAMFERWNGRLRAPWHFRADTLASFGTHDTPTLAGWWVGHDIDSRERIGHTDADTANRMRDERTFDRGVIMALLAEARLLPEGQDPEAPPEALDTAMIEAIHALMATSSAALVAMQIDDALATLEQANIPGTTDEHPNWRRRHAVGAKLLGEHPSIRRIATAMQAMGR
ncbi:MAG: 4-alpha-glucanotransferase [Pseudomonadota bacterium]